MTYINIPILIAVAMALILVFIIGAKKPVYIINFFLRIGLCFVAIYFVNQALADKGVEVLVSMNVITFLVCGLLGFPGLFLLYGTAFWFFYMG